MTKHRCFISYHKDDKTEVERFIQDFDCLMDDATALGVTDDDDFVDSDDEDYIKRVIREKYLTNTTVTIVMVGQCTKARKYVDWEIASSLRDDPNNKRSGLLGINLKAMGQTGAAPPRLATNLKEGGDGYALYHVYPTYASTLEGWIQKAFDRRESHADKVDNSADLFKNSRKCP